MHTSKGEKAYGKNYITLILKAQKTKLKYSENLLQSTTIFSPSQH